MEIIVWVLLGLLAGWISAVFMGTSELETTSDIVLGAVGAAVSGYAASFIMGGEAGSFNPYSMFAAALGALTLIWVGRGLKSDA